MSKISEDDFYNIQHDDTINERLEQLGIDAKAFYEVLMHSVDISKMENTTEKFMSGDLISRKAVMNKIAEWSSRLDCENGNQFILAEFEQLLANMPTAYDADKVIDRLSNKMFSAELYGDEWNGQTVNNLLCMGDVYEIVKDGGIDERD